MHTIEPGQRLVRRIRDARGRDHYRLGHVGSINRRGYFTFYVDGRSPGLQGWFSVNTVGGSFFRIVPDLPIPDDLYDLTKLPFSCESEECIEPLYLNHETMTCGCIECGMWHGIADTQVEQAELDEWRNREAVEA